MAEDRPFIPVLQPTFGDIETMITRFRELFASGQITVGKYTRELERQVADTLEVDHVVAVGSCTSGLILAAKALGLEGEVILPGFTFAATAHALIWNGLEPVFCDCDPQTLSLDLDHARRLITPRTSAVVPVYIFGAPPDWDGILSLAAEHGLKILADAAQGLGSAHRDRPTGGFGNIEVFSMSPTKVVTAAEGGLVTTGDGALADEIRRMRDYGKTGGGEDMDRIGLSARLSEFHAVIALENLRHLERWTTRRRQLIEHYRTELDGIPGLRYPLLPEGTRSSWNYMVVLLDPDRAPFTRDELFERLKREGIQTKRYFYPPVHRLTAYRGLLGRKIPRLPATETVSERALALPLYSHMTEDLVGEICRIVRSCG